jgi:hypothetical protein
MGHCPRWTRQFFFASGAASPARRLQIVRRRVHLGQVPQRGGGVVVMRVILAKKMQEKCVEKMRHHTHRTFAPSDFFVFFICHYLCDKTFYFLLLFLLSTFPHQRDQR